MAEDSSNIVLIGMPGSGKSTVGVILAKRTCRGFVDTDVLIETARGRPLQDIVDTEGYLALRKVEEDVILALDCRNCVIATGGSAVYSSVAMAHLKQDGIAVFLSADLPTLQARVRDFSTRGLAKRPDQGLADLFAERSALYARYADVTILCNDLTHEEVCERIIKAVERGKGTGCRRSAFQL